MGIIKKILARFKGKQKVDNPFYVKLNNVEIRKKSLNEFLSAIEDALADASSRYEDLQKDPRLVSLRDGSVFFKKDSNVVGMTSHSIKSAIANKSIGDVLRLMDATIKEIKDLLYVLYSVKKNLEKDQKQLNQELEQDRKGYKSAA